MLLYVVKRLDITGMMSSGVLTVMLSEPCCDVTWYVYQSYQTPGGKYATTDLPGSPETLIN